MFSIFLRATGKSNELYPQLQQLQESAAPAPLGREERVVSAPPAGREGEVMAILDPKHLVPCKHGVDPLGARACYNCVLEENDQLADRLQRLQRRCELPSMGRVVGEMIGFILLGVLCFVAGWSARDSRSPLLDDRPAQNIDWQDLH